MKSKMFNRAVNVLREEGAKGFFFKLLGEIGYRRLLLLERPLDEPVPEIKTTLPVSIRLLDKTELDEYLAFRPENGPSLIADWFDSGHRCFVARHEKQLISASWAATRRARIYYLDCEISLTPDEVYVYDSFTNPDFRGKSVSAAIRAEIIRHFRAAGYRRMILGTEPENKSNLYAVRKVGFRPFAMMGCMKIGRWRRDFYRVNK